MKKVNKSAVIRELLAKGLSAAEVAKKLKAKPAYVYKVAWIAKSGKGKTKIKSALKKTKKVTQSYDAVNHPPHYTSGGIETIDFILAKGLSYGLGNVVKYISRCGKKPNEAPLESLKKAAFYLNREIELLSKNN